MWNVAAVRMCVPQIAVVEFWIPSTTLSWICGILCWKGKMLLFWTKSMWKPVGNVQPVRLAPRFVPWGIMWKNQMRFAVWKSWWKGVCHRNTRNYLPIYRKREIRKALLQVRLQIHFRFLHLVKNMSSG